MTETFDELTAFLNWWLSTRNFNPPVETPTNQNGNLSGVVLYRDNSFQVQLFIVKPNSEIEPHIHPNVDSYEVYVSGDIEFMCDGVWFDQAQTQGNGVMRVRPSSWHGGKFGPRGGCFLSVQHWLNNVHPTSVGDDWADHSGNTNGVCMEA